jgi:hypothetical protein
MKAANDVRVQDVAGLEQWTLRGDPQWTQEHTEVALGLVDGVKVVLCFVLAADLGSTRG